MYIRRHMEETIRRTATMFPVVMVTGARQVGKSTLLREVNSDMPYLTMDDPVQLQSAVEEPRTFFMINPPPLVIDEIQYVPGLFPYIKMLADRERKKGQFFLSGSQQFHMMKNVSESLAGRIGILNLLGLSQREIQGVEFTEPFLPTLDYMNRRKQHIKHQSYQDVWATIHRGSMPELAQPHIDWQQYYSSYVKTYIERDVRELANIGDEVKFIRFMTAVAANIGNLLNQASIARDVGVSQPTVDRWMSILVASNIIYLLQPYHNNIVKRAIKTPKVYFLDTGLAAYLTKWQTPEVLATGSSAGAFFENFAIVEILKSYTNVGHEPMLYFYRDKEQNEIDLMIYQDGTLFPIEIKKHADPSKNDVKAFRMIDGISGVKRGQGGVLCMYDRLGAISENELIIPLGYL